MADGRGAIWKRNYAVPQAHRVGSTDGHVTGICLSGGGIRSATFCLGALQVLAAARVVSRARFLASVSGGGYLAGAYQMIQAKPGAARGGRLAVDDAFAPGSPEEDHVRRHGKYLADGAGEWAVAVFVVVRNVAFNLALAFTLLFLLATALGLGYAVPGVDGWMRRVLGSEGIFDDWSPTTVVAVLLVAVPLFFSVVAWVVSGWPSPQQPTADGAAQTTEAQASTTRRVGAAGGPRAAGEPDGSTSPSGAQRLFTRRAALHRAAGWSTGVSAVSALLVFGFPMLVDAVQGVTPPGSAPAVGALAALATAAASLWNMITGPGTGSPSLRPRLAAIGFAARAATSLLVVLGLASLAVAAFAGLLTATVRLYVLDQGDQTVGLIWAAGAGVGLGLLYWGVDQTRLSLHPFYKRRLATAFNVERARDGRDLGARERPYGVATTLSEYAEPQPGAPQLLLCAAAHVSGKAVAPPGRRVTPFVFSHDHIGGPGVGYGETKELEKHLEHTPYASDITALAATALSGAAFASASGRMSSPFNIILAVTNARLGAWLPNPALQDPEAAVWTSHELDRSEGARRARRRTRRPAGRGSWPKLPRVRRLRYLVRELVGAYSPTSPFVLVTDGGHYDNLGLMELLRRRCSRIWCLDASGDKSLADTLADSASLAYEELGVEIRIDGVPLAPASAGPGTASNKVLRDLELRIAQQSVVVAEVRYPEEAEAPVPGGWLVVGKALLTPDIPFPLRSYAARSARFPGDTTADQWFDVDQFDAYHALGRHVGQQMLLAGQSIPVQRTPVELPVPTSAWRPR